MSDAVIDGNRVVAVRLRCGFRLDRWLVLMPNEATVHPQPSLGVDADERAGDRDLGRIEDHGPIVERLERRLDLTHAAVRLVREFLRLGIFGFDLLGLGLKRVARRLLLGA